MEVQLDQLETPAAAPAAAVDKNQIIMDLVSALDAFDASTPVTAFPEKIADKAKAARALAAELKDDLLLLKQQLEDASKDLVKLQAPETGAAQVAAVGDEDLSRFASSTKRLDRVAAELEKLGLSKLATTLDMVSNTLEK